MRTSLLLMLVGSGLCWAENAKPAAPAAPAPVLERPSDVPNPEKLRRSADSVSRMRSTLRDTVSKLEEARRVKDVVKMNCVNEKLTQMKGLLRISEQADVALQEAVAQKETTSAEHEYTKVTIAGTKVRQLRTEAEECIGQLAFRTDEQQSTEVQEPNYLPTTDPSAARPPPALTSRPLPASPTL